MDSVPSQASPAELSSVVISKASVRRNEVRDMTSKMFWITLVMESQYHKGTKQDGRGSVTVSKKSL